MPEYRPMLHRHPMTPEQFTAHMSEMGWTHSEIRDFLGFEPPNEWLWRCSFCDAVNHAASMTEED